MYQTHPNSPPPQPALPEEERQKREADKRKARKNNGAKRGIHYEMEQEEHDVYPDDPDFDINKGDIGCVAIDYAVQDYLLVDFLQVDEEGNERGDVISVRLEDIVMA